MYSGCSNSELGVPEKLSCEEFLMFPSVLCVLLLVRRIRMESLYSLLYEGFLGGKGILVV